MSRLAQIQQMLAAEPLDPFLHYALGMEYVKQGDLDQGLAQFTAMNQQFPDHVAAWHQRGRLLVDRDETELARDVLRQGIAVAHRTGDSHAAGEMQGLIDLLPSAW